jgi:hypothetical protein
MPRVNQQLTLPSPAGVGPTCNANRLLAVGRWDLRLTCTTQPQVDHHRIDKLHLTGADVAEAERASSQVLLSPSAPFAFSASARVSRRQVLYLHNQKQRMPRDFFCLSVPTFGRAFDNDNDILADNKWVHDKQQSRLTRL